MKDILGKIFGGTGASIADKISGIIDRHTYSKEEKAEFQKEMDQIWIQAEADMQKNVTERWALDSQAHSSFLAKNVRPLVLLILVISTILMVFIDAGWISFDLKESHTDLLQIVLLTCIGAYFGGRSFEKVKKNG
jgi:cation transport ATPase